MAYHFDQNFKEGPSAPFPSTNSPVTSVRNAYNIRGKAKKLPNCVYVRVVGMGVYSLVTKSSFPLQHSSDLESHLACRGR